MKVSVAVKFFAVCAAFVFAFAQAFAGDSDNRNIALRALSEVFDGRDAAAIDALYHSDYVGHLPAVAEGRAGLREAVSKMRGEHPRREVARVLAQGDLVGVHSRIVSGENSDIAVDIFRIDGGKIAEHWRVRQTEVPKSETASGNSMTDGGGDANAKMSAAELTRNADNAKVFFERGIAGDVETLRRLFGDEYIQHNPHVPNGKEPIYAFFSGGDGTLNKVVVHQIIAAGDLTMSLVEYDAWGNAAVDILRHDKNGKVVEHWDVVQPIPAAEELAHNNGMF